MRADKMSMLDFLSKGLCCYIVPVYQRNYEWRMTQCGQLWSDIRRMLHGNRSHFFGTICYKEVDGLLDEQSMGRRYFLVDGQQRVTSLLLLLKALYDVTDDVSVKEYLKPFFFNSYPSVRMSGDGYVRLQLNDCDNAVYRELLLNANFEEKFDFVARQTSVYQNYIYFRRKLCDYMASGHSLSEIVDAMQGLQVVGLGIDNENPQDIFASLNSTGVGLSHVDLLRNYIFMSFSYNQQKILYVQWHAIEENVGVDRMSDFFVDYLVVVNRSNRVKSRYNSESYDIEAGNLYHTFVQFYKNLDCYNDFSKTLSLLEDMVDKSGLYADFCFSDDFDDVSNLTKSGLKFYELVCMANSYKIGSLLLALNCMYDSGRISEDDLCDCLDALITYVIRIRITGKSFSNNIFNAHMVLKCLTCYEKSFVDSFWSYLAEGAYAMPDDNLFKTSLLSFDFSRIRDTLLYLLCKIASVEDKIPIYSLCTCTLSLVWPRKRNAVWDSLSLKDKQYYRKYVLTLGNCCLVDKDMDLDSYSFDDKRFIYGASRFVSTQMVQNVGVWNSDAIYSRTVALSDVLVSVFNYPAKYMKKAVSGGDYYLLDGDFGKFTGRKPKMLFVFDNEIHVNAWNILFRLVCQNIYDSDNDGFLWAARKCPILHFDFRNSLANDSRYQYICGNVYMKGNSTETLLRNLYNLLLVYDKEYHSDWCSNVMFTVKS